MIVRLLLVGTMLALLVSCTASPTTSTTNPSIAATRPLSAPATVSGVTPLDWLSKRPFQVMPSELPQLITEGLPTGFNMLEPGFSTRELPGGHRVQMLGADYQKPIGDQVYIENAVSVQFYTYDSRDGRTEHLNMLAEQNFEWSYLEVANHIVTSYRTSGADGRVWVSSPFLIVVFSGLDTSERGPWVDVFTAVYLAKFPPP
jgi:hypothetical protein